MKINGRTVEPAKAVMTPYAMALMSEDLFQASENYKPEEAGGQAPKNAKICCVITPQDLVEMGT